MNVRPIDENSDSTRYHIRPEDIDVSRHFLSAFGWAQAEIAANWIVRFCQQLGGWKAFTKEDLNKFYLENGGKEQNKLLFKSEANRNKFPFYWLGERLLVQRPDGKCCVTNLFIDRCFLSSPKKKS